MAASSELETYYHVLNIIGQRMNTKAKAKLTLVGMADALGEKNNKQLAQTRAEQVKKYLTDVWGITASRITLQTRTATQSGNDVLEAEESRRVDILADTPEVLDEMRFDYRGKVVTPPTVRMKFDIDAPAGLQAWKLEALQDGMPLKTVRGGDRYPSSYEWNLASAPLDSLPQNAREITFRVEATDNNGRVARSLVQTVPVEIQAGSGKKPSGTTPNTSSNVKTDIYTVYSTVRGENAFSSADASVQRQLLNIMRKGIKPNSKLMISGYTDARTPADKAREITEQEAQNVANQLNLQDVMITAGGISSLHDNSLPEGRFYNRFVQVEIRNIVK
jgi:outer membrane protein OmpA-like peptidoglycan-associated protein